MKSDEYKEKYMKLKNGIVFVFAFLNDNFIFYGRSDEEKYNQLIDSFKKQFPNAKIEVIRPTNIYVGKKIKSNNDYLSSGILNSREDFEKIKEFITSPITESVEYQNDMEIPLWVKDKIERGEFVRFKDGKWYSRMS